MSESTQPVPVTKVSGALKSDVGMVREHNEDSAHLDQEGMFFIVADGMGGHAAGEVASAMAVEEVRNALDGARAQIRDFAAAPGDEGRHALVALLEDSVRRAHQSVFERGGREADKKGMGTTLEVLLIAGGEAFVAHVGDSRTYLFRAGSSAQVTTDHTVAEVLVIEGKLSAEEARQSPLRTILVNAIGVSADVGVELAHLRLRRGDKLLLCSDGLHDYFPAETELAELLAEQSGEPGLSRLVEMAKERGGHDNITGILVEVIEGAPTVAEEEAEAVKRGDAPEREPTAEHPATAAPAAVPVAIAVSPSEATQPIDTSGAVRKVDTSNTQPMQAIPAAGHGEKIESAKTEQLPAVKPPGEKETA